MLTFARHFLSGRKWVYALLNHPEGNQNCQAAYQALAQECCSSLRLLLTAAQAQRVVTSAAHPVLAAATHSQPEEQS
jgi:hypothetical protein